MLRVFEKWELRIIFGCMRYEISGSGENYIMKRLIICTPHHILSG
jgi:hypothetical protein